MDSAEVEFGGFAQNETFGSEGLRVDVWRFEFLGFNGFTWKPCVCHCALSGYGISWAVSE